MIFRSKTFLIESDKIACLVCGLGGKITTYLKAVDALNKAGYSVVIYEYDESVVALGDPELLPKLISEIADDFNEQSEPYADAMATGVSMGAYIAFNVQRRNPKVKHGVYGTAGISVAHAIFTAKVFRKYRTQFERKGYTEQSLEHTWKDIEILSDLELDDNKSLLVVMGSIDRIVRYKTASRMMDDWKKRGIKAEYFSKKGLGHALTIRWYKNNLGSLLKSYDNKIS